MRVGGWKGGWKRRCQSNRKQNPRQREHALSSVRTLLVHDRDLIAPTDEHSRNFHFCRCHHHRNPRRHLHIHIHIYIHVHPRTSPPPCSPPRPFPPPAVRSPSSTLPRSPPLLLSPVRFKIRVSRARVYGCHASKVPAIRRDRIAVGSSVDRYRRRFHIFTFSLVPLPQVSGTERKSGARDSRDSVCRTGIGNIDVD